MDVADVTDLGPAEEPKRPDSGHSGSRLPDGDISPMWSELIDTTGSGHAPVSADPDAPLLDDTTLGGRRAKQYDMQEDIDEITEGGGGVYRGRRARRRPDSA
ncbi:hypothetical protein [Phytoactinopolyspora endophytica]|uniref:hypothetical protein n=1 Tax=Phytoactinopolyspora endophytica TaxID=1642495 RepID=UPI001F0FE55D|nr:hypothetical protein [Phytoactinopolyspora endophytica]